MTALSWIGVGCGVFLAALVYDVACSRYLAAVSVLDPARAAAWSAMTYVIGLVGLVGVLRASAWLALPEVLGLAVGTFVGVSRTASEFRKRDARREVT